MWRLLCQKKIEKKRKTSNIYRKPFLKKSIICKNALKQNIYICPTRFENAQKKRTNIQCSYDQNHTLTAKGRAGGGRERRQVPALQGCPSDGVKKEGGGGERKDELRILMTPEREKKKRPLQTLGVRSPPQLHNSAAFVCTASNSVELRFGFVHLQAFGLPALLNHGNLSLHVVGNFHLIHDLRQINLHGVLSFGWLDHLHHLGHICLLVWVLYLSSDPSGS